jgi:tRNA threonylcarbamoyladenosine biosynthesis protein TsaE
VTSDKQKTKLPRNIVTHSAEETISLGYELARELASSLVGAPEVDAPQKKASVLVLLLGDLGAGKTTLTKGLVAGLGAAPEEDVTSPTFTMIHEYGAAPLGRIGARAPGPDDPTAFGSSLATSGAARVYHVDLYRVETARELETLGLEDLLAESAVVIIEWGEKLGPALRPSGTGRLIEIHLQAVGEDERQIEIMEGS